MTQPSGMESDVEPERLWILTVDGEEWGAYETEERVCQFAESWYRAGVRGMDIHTVEIGDDMDGDGS